MHTHKQPGLVRTLGSGLIQRLILAAFVIALCLPAAVFAQATSGSITGRVLNAGNGRYLNNARVTIEGTNQEAFTDEFGGYRFDNVPAYVPPGHGMVYLTAVVLARSALLWLRQSRGDQCHA